MMNVLIVDDEPLARARLKKQIESIDGVSVAGEAGDGKQALKAVDQLKPDIVLLDIRMPGMSGLEAGRHLMQLEQPPAVIFTTAYSEHALEAFDAHAIGYLLKPVSVEKLTDALQAAKKLTRVQVEQAGQIDDEARTHICARVRGNLELINVRDIYYFKADSKYVEVRHHHGQVLIEESLTALEKEFAEYFIRVHRNALVAKKEMLKLEKDNAGRRHISFKQIADTIEVSRRHLPKIRALFKG